MLERLKVNQNLAFIVQMSQCLSSFLVIEAFFRRLFELASLLLALQDLL